jgi:hypothetical protein
LDSDTNLGFGHVLEIIFGNVTQLTLLPLTFQGFACLNDDDFHKFFGLRCVCLVVSDAWSRMLGAVARSLRTPRALRHASDDNAAKLKSATRRALSTEKTRWDGSGRWENLSDDFMHAEQYGNCMFGPRAEGKL